MKRRLALIPFLLLLFVGALCIVFPNLPGDTSQITRGIDKADTAWMLCSTALVFIMTPGLAFFYGGMVNRKNVISTMLQSFICMAVISMLWVFVGFGLAFGNTWAGIWGNPGQFFLMRHVIDGHPWSLAPTIPLLVFAFYQLKFAIITPALITGAFAERIRFTSYVLFICLFTIFIYCPLAHAAWHPDGMLFKMGVLDFAGGTVVHMSAGWAALASALYLKQRHEPTHEPANIPFVMLGTGLLWFGWFGFNAGSAFGANNLAATALATTTTASASAALAWIFFESVKGKKPSALGTCIGAVVGLVAITPAAGFVSIPHSIVIGIASSLVSNWVVGLRAKSNRVDDTLDVFPCHGIGGIMGMILTGVFAHQSINAGNTTGNGLIFGATHLFLMHMIALVGVSVFAFGGSWLLLKVTDMITPLRVKKEEEYLGLDVSQHAERVAA